jgi:hypothetical protein
MAKLHTYPNLILWVAGHRHLTAVTALESPDPDRPELGFWEVETLSLRDFPQQFRTFEIVGNGDDTVPFWPPVPILQSGRTSGPTPTTGSTTS